MKSLTIEVGQVWYSDNARLNENNIDFRKLVIDKDWGGLGFTIIFPNNTTPWLEFNWTTGSIEGWICTYGYSLNKSKNFKSLYDKLNETC